MTGSVLNIEVNKTVSALNKLLGQWSKQRSNHIMIGSVTSAMTERYPEDTESAKNEPQPWLFLVCMCEHAHAFMYVGEKTEAS